MTDLCRPVTLAISFCLAVLLAACGASPVAVAAATPDPCVGHGTVVLVETGVHELHLCEDGKSARAFPVALGHGGLDKRREGDAKTPLGAYDLGPPRASVSGYHRFIPIGYPTAAQREAGLTGSDVGIHGPSRATADLGEAANTAVDYTLGCVALGTDEAVEAVEAWMLRHRVERVVVEPVRE